MAHKITKAQGNQVRRRAKINGKDMVIRLTQHGIYYKPYKALKSHEVFVPHTVNVITKKEAK